MSTDNDNTEDRLVECGDEHGTSRTIRSTMLRKQEVLAGAATADVAGGEYELRGKIGQGGMGVIYEARQAALDRIIALKKIALRRGRSLPAQRVPDGDCGHR